MQSQSITVILQPAAAFCTLELGISGVHLGEAPLRGLVVDPPPGLVRSLGLLHVHVEAVDGVAALVDGSFPQQHQGVAAHLADLQVVRRPCVSNMHMSGDCKTRTRPEGSWCPS